MYVEFNTFAHIFKFKLNGIYSTNIIQSSKLKTDKTFLQNIGLSNIIRALTIYR